VTVTKPIWNSVPVMSGAPLTVLITMHAHPGKLEDLVEQCRTVTGVGRGEHGALSFSYSVEGERLLAIETYADAAAYERHLELAATIVAHAQELADVESIRFVGRSEDLEALVDVVANYGAAVAPAVAGFQH
jgi:quinol monooxygenase YgiN